MRRGRDSNPPTFALFSDFRRNPYGLEIYTARRLANCLDTTPQGKFKMPRWIVYDRSLDTSPVALDTALDTNHAQAGLGDRLLPGPCETIRCSNLETAQRIADWLNEQAKGACKR